jgi:uncharacterized protein YfaS (alpha-2-macroglobulin family)
MPTLGSKFFLIAETPFGSDENAMVRLDGPGYGDDDADIIVYRVPEPLAFLKKQRNLHRIQVAAKPRPEGIANALSYVFDVCYKQSRLAWQRIFSEQARTQVVASIPELKQTPPYSYQTEFRHDPQIAPLPGFEVVDRFRYPIWEAKPIQQDAGLQMQGSSSEFTAPKRGDVKIPLGKLAPGLYLVEAAIGGHRALTVVFVSDVVAIAKVSREQLVVWTADRKNGQPAGQSRVLFFDGVGVIQEGETDNRGLLTLRGKTPERSYLIGQDSHGGVFVSENFYYDSEIEGDKLYAFTDRPLYQPGDTVHVKLVGRSFRDDLQSSPLAAGEVSLSVLDPNGTPMSNESFKVLAQQGGNIDFRLPQEAIAGGYTLNMRYQGASYMGAFRVAAYTKPHFDVDVTTREQDYLTGQPIHAKIQLRYPSGEPVKGATVELNLRSQALNLLGNDSSYSNYYTGAQVHFPVKLTQESREADANGVVEFELPAAKEPSHYILRVVCADSTAYRVSAVKELIIESGHKLFSISTAARISKAGDGIDFKAVPLPGTQTAPGQAASWESLRLEDQSRSSGEVKDGQFRIEFAQAGSYTLLLKDQAGEVVGQSEHWVSGNGAKLLAGGIRIDLDKDQYRDGDTAHALITFREPVENALLTLERDAVEGSGLISEPGHWMTLSKLNDSQWQADIPIRQDYAPNRVLSVLYVKDGQFNFQNKGIKVQVPAVEVAFTPDKSVYLPGDEVRVEVRSQLNGKPVASHIAVSVVDEAVYGLQPEIAPNIQEFFQHIRRNQVRTSSSLNFHAYDMAMPVDESAPPAPSYSNRPLKMLERPRRESIDTAAWIPDLETDADGKASFSFKMPQSMSRWRITGRAWTNAGAFGQSLGQLLSAKDVYLKWTGPTAFVDGEKPVMTLVAYNRKTETQSANFAASGNGITVQKAVELQPGANYLQLPFEAHGGDKFLLTTSLTVAGQVGDQLDTEISVLAKGWQTSYSMPVALNAEGSTISVPAGAENVRISAAERGGQQLWRVAESLIAYPYGCAEQTASRLIPLSLAYDQLNKASIEPATLKIAKQLRDEMANARLRLVKMAGPNSAFGWWGNESKDDLLLTAYAYFADWHTQRSLGISAPPVTWLGLLDAYKQLADGESSLTQATALWLINEMGMPVKTQSRALVKRLVQNQNSKIGNDAGLLGHVLQEQTANMPTAAAALKQQQGLALVMLDSFGDVGAYDPAARAVVDTFIADTPLAKAAVLLNQSSKGHAPDDAEIGKLLDSVGPQTPTLERSLILLMTQKAVIAPLAQTRATLDLSANPPITPVQSPLGLQTWMLANNPSAATEPMSLQLSAPQPATANVSYDLHETEVQHPLAGVQLQRKLYKLELNKSEGTEAPVNTESQAEHEPSEADSENLEQSEPFYLATEVTAGQPIDASALYLDEVVVSSQTGKRRYGALEIPLSSGAELESVPWGMKVAKDAQATPEQLLELQNGEVQAFPHHYTIPLETLEGELRFMHLLRFSQRGEFELGRARYFDMYHQQQQVLQSNPALAIKVR